jgi:hypothetical protein
MTILPGSNPPSVFAFRELLFAIAERPPRSAPERVTELASAIGDWPSLLQMARQHRVASLLWSRLSASRTPLPSAAEGELRDDYQRNLVCAMANAAELLGILGMLSARGIDALPFKGVVLAISAWGDLATRPAGDLDLLIRFRDLKTATGLLLALGYELYTPVLADGSPAEEQCHEYHFERASDGMVIELRWELDLFYGRFSRSLGLDWLWPHRCTATLAGSAVPDIAPEFKLLVISMHACRHTWSRLIWVCDVAQVIAAYPELDWERAIREAARAGLFRSLRLAVLLAHKIAGAQVPEPVLRRFQRDTTAEALVRHFVENIFEAPGVGPRGRIPYNFRLLDREDQLRYLFSAGPLRPSKNDRNFLPLPKPLEALYYFVRPLRLLLDRSPR